MILVLLLSIGLFFLIAIMIIFWLMIAVGDMPWREAAFQLSNYRGSLFGTFIAAFAVGGTLLTFAQKRDSDDRAAYYERVQWAIDHTLATDPAEQAVGWYFLGAMVESRLADVEDEHFKKSVIDYNRKFNPLNAPPEEAD